MLFVIDGAKALRKAIRDVFGVAAPVQRCIRHKERNVLEHLPERNRPQVRRRLCQPWKLDDHAAALERLLVLAAEFDRTHPGAAGSLRESLQETLTVTRLGVRGALRKTRIDEPVRVDDRVRPPHRPASKMLALEPADAVVLTYSSAPTLATRPR